MRTRTFVLSFLVHSCVIIAAMVVRLFAATELPDPPRSTSFMMAAATGASKAGRDVGDESHHHADPGSRLDRP